MKKRLSIILSLSSIAVVPFVTASCSVVDNSLDNNDFDQQDNNQQEDDKQEQLPNDNNNLPIPPTNNDSQNKPTDPPSINPEKPEQNDPPNNNELTIDQKIFNDINLVKKQNGYDYQEVYTKDFVKYSLFENDKKNIKNYFEINLEYLKNKYGQEMSKYQDFTFNFSKYENQRFNFNNPSSIEFKIEFKKDGQYLEKIVTINGFKTNPDWWGELDRQPIEELKTPEGSVSYKGKLEKFKLSDLTEVSSRYYENQLDKTTKEDIKLNFMYQVRFGLYQMFSDNFSEINYYIKNETNNGFVAVATGIIKEDKNNIKWAIQPHQATSGFNGTTNVKKNDVVVYEIVYNNKFNKPTLLANGNNIMPGFANSWYWDFSDNCQNLTDKNNSLFVDKNMFRDNWTSVEKIYINLSLNNQKLFNDNNGISQWNFYNFVLKMKSNGR